MKKLFIISVFIITFSINSFAQEQKRNFIVLPTNGYIFMWPFPDYWVNDSSFARRIGQAAIFYLNKYKVENSIVHFGIAFGDETSKTSFNNFITKNNNQFKNNIGNDYIAEQANWNISRSDKTKIIVYKLYSKQRTMYQYCAYIQNEMRNYIIAYIQLNTDSDENEKYINDFKNFLETVSITEGYLDIGN